MSEYQHLIVERKDAITTLTLNRPEVHNALDRKLSEELHQAVRQVRDDRDCRIMILRGAGDTFCAGDDIKDFMSWSADDPHRGHDAYWQVRKYQETVMQQLNEAIQFLRDHASEYGLDMSNVVITGGSGGAHMTAQYGLIVSDPAYAAEVGIEPALPASEVKALGILVAPLRFSGFGWRASAMFWPYLGTKDLEGSPAARQNDIIAHVSSRYPPTYITDGNDDDTFPEQNKAMARSLREKNVDHEFYFTEKHVAVLGHGYTSDLSTEYGRENLRRMTAFFKLRCGMAE